MSRLTLDHPVFGFFNKSIWLQGNTKPLWEVVMSSAITGNSDRG